MTMRLTFIMACAAMAASIGARAEPSAEYVDKRIVLSQFADCLTRMGPAQSEALLRTEFGADAERRAAETLVHAHSTCMTDRMVLSMQAPMIRGLVAEAMFARHHPDWLVAAGKMPATAPVRPLRPIQAAALQKGRLPDAQRERAFMAAYTGCLVKAAPAKVAAVLATGIASPEEHDATLALGDNLHDCMPIGAQYVLNVGGLRANLASMLYLQFATQSQPVSAR